MHLYGLPLEALAALAAGVLILVWPRVLSYAIAAYLLLVGALGALHAWQGHPVRPQAVIALVAGILILVKPTILSYVVGGYLIVLGLLEAGFLRW
jgi:hypothetical protein